jgi:hypothetical protein
MSAAQRLLDVLDALPKLNVTESASVCQEHECPICFDPLGAYEAVLACKHSYHATCLNAWLERGGTCPLCRHTAWQVGR